jgi:isopenicillin N synthase-like dioxygenase
LDLVPTLTIPEIDFGPFLTGDMEAKQAVARQLYAACHEVGFLYLINHGMSQGDLDMLFAAAQSFFALPADQKQQVARSPETNCGYVGLASENLNLQRPKDWKEAFNVGRKAEWPSNPPDFRPTVWHFYNTCVTGIVRQVLRAFALALGLPEAYFESRHGEFIFLRLLHYPPLPSNLQSEQIRAGEHTDYGTFTLLFQNDGAGLEVCTRTGEWIAVPPRAGAIVVNIGDALQRWTNNQLRSTPHRVVNPQGEAQLQSRYSAALFCDPDPDVKIRCLDSCQSADYPAEYPPIQAGAYLRSRLDPTYQ